MRLTDITQIPGVAMTPLKLFTNESGGVYHVMRHTDVGFRGFQEAYISTVNGGVIKSWRRHRRMTLNLIVPAGRVQFRAVAGLEASGICGATELSVAHYYRLTVQPGIWLSFRGEADGLNMVINVADLVHDPAEADVLPLTTPELAWCWQRDFKSL
jgi:dTDP-4-dehydrorhamnose 3,5-epimerase